MITLTVNKSYDNDLQEVCTYFQVWVEDETNFDVTILNFDNDVKCYITLTYQDLDFPLLISDFFDAIEESGYFSMQQIKEFFQTSTVTLDTTFSHTRLGLLNNFLDDYQETSPIFTWND